MTEFIVAELESNCLFRVDDCWYRLVNHNKKFSVVEVVGQNGITKKIDPSTEVSEISVLSKK